MADNPTTIVGPSILVSGHLEGDEDLTVLGRVHGSINLTQTLIVEESGILKADVSVRNAIISGVVVGNIEATDSVELTPEGRMVGDIKAPRIMIVDGARFRGNVDMGNLDAPRATGPLPARTVEPMRRSSAMTRTTTTRPTMTPARRAAPPAPAPEPAPAKVARPPMKKAPAAPVKKKKAPVAAKKKIKKRVVARKGR